MESPHSLTIVLPLPDPLLSGNYRRRHHWSTQRRHTEAQRLEAMYCGIAARAKWADDHDADDVPHPHFPAGRVRVDAEVRPRKGMKRHDDTAIWEALKPVLDGLEDVGIVVNDKQFLVGSLAWDKSRRTGELILTLTAEEA